jgi:hypothetical protein
VAKQLSQLDSSTDCKLVELYLNGEYNGVYLLCEQVEVNEHRVEVDEDSATDDTGYLVEMDGWADGTCVTVPDPLDGETGKNRKYSIKAPDKISTSPTRKNYIYQYLTDCMTAIYGTDYERVKELMDVESFAQAYIIFELFKNPDVNYSSFFMHKDKGGKLFCGPVWDFDMSCGNVSHKGGNKYNELWAKKTNPWFNGLLRFEEFRNLVAEQLRSNQSIIESTLDDCYNYAYSVDNSIKLNWERWNIEENTWNPNYILALKTWEEQVEYTRTFLENSYNFLLETYQLPTQ